MTNAEKLNRIKKGLSCSDEEAASILAYDKAIDNDEKTEFDLSPERERIARQYLPCEQRTKPATHKPNTRKENPDRRKLIEMFTNTLTQAGIKSTIENAERIISFSYQGKLYSLTLANKRK